MDRHEEAERYEKMERDWDAHVEQQAHRQQEEEGPKPPPMHLDRDGDRYFLIDNETGRSSESSLAADDVVEMMTHGWPWDAGEYAMHYWEGFAGSRNERRS